ncbi:protein of unknown function [Streptomyces sp. 2231.1]|uniref:DUF397 domain-containing protein n=1 Tax=Streptomyces sp. 2231.1 TaxID=1855347 RepID=UPI000894708C|nr:DUF397 domain-containing protein [Streptomyces sp. 2231.1]SED20671.1 protein of unknown function [Streptomyces sp. 2231.1]
MNTEELAWLKSSYSGGEGGECVEVALEATAIHIRDSKRRPTAPHLTVTPTAWSLFLLGEKERLRD